MSFQRILIGISENPIAIHAMEVGASLAKSLSAQITLVHLIDPKLYGITGGRLSCVGNSRRVPP